MRYEKLRRALILWAAVGIAASARAADDLQYKVPDGWVNLTNPASLPPNAPRAVAAEAASGKYAVFAGDPTRMTNQIVPVSMNVVEAKTTGKVTEGIVKQGAMEMVNQMRGIGATVTLGDIKVLKLEGVDIGFVHSFVETPRGSMQMDQYMIPGKTKLGVLTYVCPGADYDHYKPIFEASAMGTTGAYSHGAFNFSRIWVFGVLGALAAVIIAIINGSKSKPQPAPVAATTLPRTTMPGVALGWDCPNCKRRVPIRIEQCRCGTPRPA
jgi:hypothetical protein